VLPKLSTPGDPKQFFPSFDIVAVGELTDFFETKASNGTDTFSPIIVLFLVFAKPADLVTPTDDIAYLLIEFVDDTIVNCSNSLPRADGVSILLSALSLSKAPRDTSQCWEWTTPLGHDEQIVIKTTEIGDATVVKLREPVVNEVYPAVSAVSTVASVHPPGVEDL